ncbi:hypothetical protein [Dyadobacter crusticola]|uniref:hypothetical protein n=1 Tax=Dyadobacter crusticola TaxID=292407 RepID=UPI000A5017CE|nr:hypothetical protein [Dyadobacter crusticola]
MKAISKILGTIFLLLGSLNIYAATNPIVRIKGYQASSIHDGINFFNLNPSNASYSNQYKYDALIEFADESTIPKTAAVSYEWIPVGGTVINGKNSSQLTITWDNTKNYNNGIPSKSLRLKVTFKWTPQGGSEQTQDILSRLANDAALAQPIEVKYISEPTSLSFNGSTVGNNSSLQYACGAGQKTISVPAVVTDPNAPVTYYFYYPAGWSGPASSTVPSVTVNTHVNAAGKITVEAKRNDTDNFRTKITINITRPTPTKPVINSPDILLCAPKIITASANNATSYTWSTTGGVTATPQVNTSSAQITGVSDGTVKVAAVSSVCAMTSAFSSPINVKRSAPKPASLLVTANGGGSPDFMCNGAGVMLNAYTSEPGTVFGQWKASDPANTILNGNGGSAYFNSYVNNCYGIDIVVSNCFGTVQKGITICVDNCAKPNPIYAIYPNPASDFINIAFGEADSVELPEFINITSEREEKAIRSLIVAEQDLNDNVLRVPVSDLPRGVYYFVFVYKNSLPKSTRVLLE